MYLIALFGILMMAFSIVMVVSPASWSEGIVRFSGKKYFHLFEILSRLGVGLIFIKFSAQTLYPQVNSFLGYMLLAVGVGLLIIRPARHRQFAVWSARRFLNVFRPAGVFSLLFGAFIVYSALGAKAL